MGIGWIDASLLAVIEGVTEFLPVSSTGHMIIYKDLRELPASEALDAYLVVVQAGGILAVLTIFWQYFLQSLVAWINLLGPKTREVLKPWLEKSIKRPLDERTEGELRMRLLRLALSCVPFGVLGFLGRATIKSWFSLQVVAAALLAGGFLILAAERLPERISRRSEGVGQLTWRDAFLVGCGQCLALWPGFSRSAATLLTARVLGYSRASAAEISFLVGFPTLLGAAGYEAIKSARFLTGEWIAYVIAGVLIAWLVAFVCVKSFVSYLKRYSMDVFAWYRIALGAALLYMISR